MIKELKKLPRQERMRRIEEILNDPAQLINDALLAQLTDAVLHEELSDPNVHKIAHNEYPILSDRMLRRRREGRERHRNRAGTVIREVPMKHASNVAVDGKDYTRPVRYYINPN